MADATGVVEDPPATERPHWSDRWFDAIQPPYVVLGLVIALWCVWFVRLAALRNDRFGTFGFDLGIYDQGVWLLAHGRDPFVTIRGLELFGHHMNVMLVLLAPFYRLGAGPEFLLGVQVAAQALGAVAIFLLGRDVLHSKWMGVGLATALLCNPTYQWLVWEFFHPDAVAIGPLLLAYWAARQERWGWFTVAAVLALACKEDVALTMVVLGLLVGFRLQAKTGRVVLGMAVAAAGVLIPIQAGPQALLLLALCIAAGGIAIAWLYGTTDRIWTVIGLGVALAAALVPIQSDDTWKLAVGGLVFVAGVAFALDRKPTWKIGTSIALVAAAWFVLATRVLIPRFNGVGPFYDSFFPPELGSSPTDMIRNASQHPSRAYEMLDDEAQTSWYWHMLAPWALLPLFNLRVLALAFPMITVDVLTYFPYTRDYRYHYSALVVAGCALATVETIGAIKRRTTYGQMAGTALVVLVLVTSVISTYQWGASPIAKDYEYIWPFHTDGANRARREGVALLPDDAATTASYSFIPHISHRERVYEWPVPWCNINWGVDGENLDRPADVDWLLVDRDLVAPEHQALLADLLADEFTVRFERDGIVLAERTSPPTFTRESQPPPFLCEPRPAN
ncbi:MAG TPA: DUF2079 domain-containing protein [Acidimicrobiia bacterium]|nr:DUF2079 domain-containing protein [Acidimicrobiia bacterium]